MPGPARQFTVSGFPPWLPWFASNFLPVAIVVLPTAGLSPFRRCQPAVCLHWAEVNEACLVGMEREPEPFKTLAQDRQDATPGEAGFFDAGLGRTRGGGEVSDSFSNPHTANCIMTSRLCPPSHWKHRVFLSD
jgi:hypothetical protein